MKIFKINHELFANETFYANSVEEIIKLYPEAIDAKVNDAYTKRQVRKIVRKHSEEVVTFIFDLDQAIRIYNKLGFYTDETAVEWGPWKWQTPYQHICKTSRGKSIRNTGSGYRIPYTKSANVSTLHTKGWEGHHERSRECAYDLCIEQIQKTLNGAGSPKDLGSIAIYKDIILAGKALLAENMVARVV